MDSEAKIILTFLFKRSGKKQLTFSELYLTLSIDLNWFTPEDAKKFVNEALEKKFLTKKKDLIMPSFDIEKVSVPVGFYPSKRVFMDEEPLEVKEETDLLSQIIKIIAEKVKLKEQDILIKIKKIEDEKKVTTEVAALLFGKENNLDLSEFFERIENNIFT
jgi:hypothetical protein